MFDVNTSVFTIINARIRLESPNMCANTSSCHDRCYKQKDFFIGNTLLLFMGIRFSLSTSIEFLRIRRCRKKNSPKIIFQLNWATPRISRLPLLSCDFLYYAAHFGVYISNCRVTATNHLIQNNTIISKVFLISKV